MGETGRQMLEAAAGEQDCSPEMEKRMKRIKWHLLCWGPPSDLDTPGPSSVVCKYHQPLNEQWRDKSFEMKLQRRMGDQMTPKGLYLLFRLCEQNFN